jgi:hypothetical protein
MPTPTTAALDALATYRLTRLVIEDEVTAPLRDAAYARLKPGGKLAYLLSCPWCVSIWAGGALSVLRAASPRAANVVSTALAASAVTGVLYEKL